MSDKLLLTKAELADKLKCSKGTITSYSKSGVLVFEKVNGKDVIDYEVACKALKDKTNSKIIKTVDDDNEEYEANYFEGDLFALPLDEFKRQIKNLSPTETKLVDLKMDVINKKIKLDGTIGDVIPKTEVDIFSFELGDFFKKASENLENSIFTKILGVSDEVLLRNILKSEFEAYRLDIIYDMVDREFKKISDVENFDDFDDNELYEDETDLDE